MELNILIETGEACLFKIKDITCGDFGYLPESSEVSEVGRFKYNDSISILRLTLNTSAESIVKNTLIIPHMIEPLFITVPSEFDGWFTLDYIVIPTKNWFDKSEGDWIYYDTIYYSDGETIYKYFLGESTLVSQDELFERNPEGTTISKLTQNLMSICHLKKCFISLCKDVFDMRGFNRCLTRGRIDTNTIYYRDLVWMTINVISYFTEFGLLAEAERILEKVLEGCNGICKPVYRELAIVGCGCS